MDNHSILFASGLQLAERIKKREISPVEVVQACLDQVDRVNPELNAIIWRRDEQLLEEARLAEEKVMSGDDLPPFHGVPMPVKDLTDVEGWPTTFGSMGAKDRVAPGDATVVSQFRDAGFLLMGRSNTPEFGTLPVTENQAWGATRNPWDKTRSPGGSSGGAGAAVASGMVPIAHANDGGGSIRLPAGWSGLVGLKPSRGRTCSGPPVVSDVMLGFAVEGCVSRTVTDTAAVLDAIAPYDPLAWYTAPRPATTFLDASRSSSGGSQRIAFTTASPMGDPVDQESIKAVELTARLLEEAGHEVFEAAPDWQMGPEFLDLFKVVWNTGPLFWDVQDWSKVEPLNVAMRESAMQTSSADYAASVAALQMYSRRVVTSWQNFDVLLTPTAACLPPPIGVLWEGAGDDPMYPLNKAAQLVPFTPVFNVTGQPAISLPVHLSAEGLPVGIQLVAAPWQDELLLQLGAQLEAVVGWAERIPGQSD
jgi:amidase